MKASVLSLVFGFISIINIFSQNPLKLLLIHSSHKILTLTIERLAFSQVNLKTSYLNVLFYYNEASSVFLIIINYHV